MADNKVVLEKRLAENKNDIKFLLEILTTHDQYWISQTNGASIPAELAALKKQLPVNVNQNDVLPANIFELLKTGIKSGGTLNAIFELIQHIEKGEGKKFRDQSKVLLGEIKGFEFQANLKAKTGMLERAEKSKNQPEESQSHYELAILYRNGDGLRAYNQEAMVHLSKVIALKGGRNETKAYALRERAALFLKEANTADKSFSDLEEAGKLLDSCEELNETKEIQEKARTYLACARAKVIKNLHSEAVPYIKKALQLRPQHLETVVMLMDVYNYINKYRNIFECLAELSRDLPLLPPVDTLLKKEELKTLWLSASGFGSLPLLEYLSIADINKQITDKDGNNGLHIIAREGHVHLLPLMLRYHSIDSLNKADLTPLFVAAQHGKVNMVMALLQQGSKRATNNTDVLSVTVKYQQGCVLEALLQGDESSAGISAPLVQEQPVESAVTQSKGGSAGQLLRVGYDSLLVEIGKQYCGSTVNKTIAEQEKLQKEACASQLFRVAIDQRSAPMLKILSRVHPDGLHRVYLGQSPLHYASLKIFKDGVYRLVEGGSNLLLVNSEKKTAADLCETLDVELNTYLKNEMRRQLDEAKEVDNKRKVFIEQVIQQFEQDVPEKYKALTIGDNKKRLLDALTACLEKPEFASLFRGESFRNIQSLLSLLVNTLITDAIQGKITKYEGMLWSFAFDQTKLVTKILSLVQSPWQTKKAVDPKPDLKKQTEVAQSYESGKLSPTKDAFCDRFERQVDAAYAYFTALANGEVVAKKDAEDKSKAEMGKQIASHLPNVPIPMTGLSLPTGILISGVMDLALYFRQQFRKKQAERMMQLFKAVTPYERAHFIRFTAEQLAHKYEAQIHHLSPGSEGVEQFADCAAARVVEYITSDSAHQIASDPSIFSDTLRKMKAWVLGKEIPPEQSKLKTLYAVFLDGIVRVVKSDFPKGKERLKTINQLTLTDNWTANGIFENTGVLVLQADGSVLRYAHPNVDVNRYGYCNGTKEEAESRDLSLGPNPKKGQFWAEGRVWEPLEYTVAVPSLQTSGKPNVILTSFQQSQTVAATAASAATATATATTTADKKLDYKPRWMNEMRK